MKRLFHFLSLGFFVLLSSAFMPNEKGYQVGDTATDFSLKSVNGQMVSLSDYKTAKGFVVTFTCNTCPYSKLYEDRLVALHKKYAPKGYPVVAINPNDAGLSPGDSFQEMQKRAKQKNFPFAYLQDETQEVTKRYGATRTPHVYVLTLSANNVLKVAYIGAVDDNSGDPEKVEKRFLENALNDIIAGKSVQQNSTKAIGCTIKWKGNS